MKVSVKLVAAFALGVLAGALIIYVGSSLWPRPTIYDRLSELQLSFQKEDFSTNSLEHAAYIQQYDFLQSLKNAYDEKQSQKGTYDSLHVYLDTNKNIVWLELWLDNEPANLEYLGFYVYQETD